MARHRYRRAELTRLFESAPLPVYLLDDQLRLVFLNAACHQWLGPDAEDLVGLRCVYDSSAAASGPEALAAALAPPPSVLEGRELVAELTLPVGRPAERRGARFLPLLAGQTVFGVIALVGDPQGSVPAAAGRAGDDEPVRLHDHLRRLRRELCLTGAAEVLAGTSPALVRARAQAELAAASRASVLVIGPARSGRRRLAEAIHYGADPLWAGPLLPLDCSLPDAETVQWSLRALGPGGSAGPVPPTLLLLDADRLPLEIQAEIVPIVSGAVGSASGATGSASGATGSASGATGSASAALRLLATSEVSLAELARHGRYRADLAARLSTITIELPPLAQRREDLPLLAQAFLEACNCKSGKQLAGFSPEALDCLDAYAWPGELAELAAVVAESCRRAARPLVAAAELPEQIHLAAQAAERPRRKEETILLDEFVERIERKLIRRALARAKGNKAKAARLLGLNRPRLVPPHGPTRIAR